METNGNRQKRVVVTGIGMITPLGHDTKSTWKGITEGRSGAGPITLFDPSDLRVRFACEVKDFDPTVALDKKAARRTDRFSHFAVVAAREAVADAELDIRGREAPERVGVSVASAMGGLETLGDGFQLLVDEGPDRMSPFVVSALIPNMAAAVVSIELGTQGPAAASCTACAASAFAIGDAAMYIRDDRADVMLAGGSEATITPIGIAGFAAMRAMSTRNDDPETACRPFDRDRDGIVMGEGAGILVLEELEHARSRGAQIYAELLGYGLTADAWHVTALDESGRQPGRALRIALDEAGLEPGDIGYLNAHATSTPQGDAAETTVVKLVFGEDKAKELPVSSTKSMTGHMLGAAGAVEAGFTILAMRDNVLPPTINFETPDPECDLDFVPNDARPAEVKYALSNGFGFGGHNASLVFGRWDEPGGRRAS